MKILFADEIFCRWLRFTARSFAEILPAVSIRLKNKQIENKAAGVSFGTFSP